MVNIPLPFAQLKTSERVGLAIPLEAPTAPSSELPPSPPSNQVILFSEHELVNAQPSVQGSPPLPSTRGAETSLMGTSGPLLTNLSLTDMLSNFPIWPQVDQPVTNASSDPSLDTIQPTSLLSASAAAHSTHQVDQQKRRT